MTLPTQPEPHRALAWSAEHAREFGEMALDIWSELVGRIGDDLPVVRNHDVPTLRAAVNIEIPDAPMALDAIEEHLRTVVFDESMYPGHPGFMAYVSGAGTVPGAAADLIAAGLNQNVGGHMLSPAATELERHLVAWFASKIGFPSHTAGYITTGGAAANLIGLTLARHTKAGWDIRADGVRGGPQLVVYVSTETHATIDRAAQMLGLGSRGVRLIPVDERLRMDVDALDCAIRDDRAAGNQPICVVGTAGTTGTGAIDPLNALADVCAAHDLWFHIDGAYGGAAAMTGELRRLFAGIERADSFGFDPHKWMYTPLVGACFLTTHPEVLRQVYAVDPSYIIQDEDLDGTGYNIGYMGPGFSRGFSALKIWVSLLAHGWRAYEERICHDVSLAGYLESLVEATPELEVVMGHTLSITSFRYIPDDLAGNASADSYLNELNEAILHTLETGGRVFPSNADVGGVFAIRSCVVNFRTEAEHMDLLVAETLRIGAMHDQRLRPEVLQ